MSLSPSAMHHFRRPLAPIAAGVMTGVALAEAGSALPFAIPVVILLAVLLLKINFVPRGIIAIVAVAVLVGWLRQSVSVLSATDDIAQHNGVGWITVAGVVGSDVEDTDSRYTCLIDPVNVTLSDGRTLKSSGQLALAVPAHPGSKMPLYGDYIEARGQISEPSSPANPDVFRYSDYLQTMHIRSALVVRRVRDWSFKEREPGLVGTMHRLAVRCRNSLISTWNRCLSPCEAGLLEGIVLGSRNHLPTAVNDDFSVNGTAHILAASGMNVAMVAMIITWCCGLLKLGRRFTIATTFTGLAFYSIVCGSGPSVMRADLMASIVLAGRLMDRESDNLNSLCAAVVLLLGWEPANLFDIGFQLSFAIAGAVILAMPLLENWWSRVGEHKATYTDRATTGLAKAGIGAVFISTVAQIAAAPIIAQQFHQVSIAGPLANALILWPIFILMAAGISVWVAFAILPIVGAIVAIPTGWLLAYLLGASRFCAELPFAAISITSPGWTIITIYYFFLILVLLKCEQKVEKSKKYACAMPNMLRS